ncbi:MAG: methylmalonyl Co-A mutase-associated GTPase MeaB [Deltaproteobacteria bacterium]|nr:methylmalonyl Co-A mutase-associated GTPase MeaB [Deltaproteobacteria bacterium]
MAPAPSVEAIAQGVLGGDRALLGRAITLVESRLPGHRIEAQALLERLLPHAGRSVRVGVSGAPGAGKSTFIEALGSMLLDRGHRVAVLAVDPSSCLSGGSILGDKTRMERVATHANAFVRPSPTGGALGGVARRTREAVLVVEAAGYDVVLVETVGVGQSETLVADMVDCFLVLLAPGAGDELQGIKRGILELADLVAVNKADGDAKPAALRAVRDFEAALRYARPPDPDWRTPVLPVSGRTGEGLVELWEQVEAHRRIREASGALERRRRDQSLRWLWGLVEEGLLDALRAHPEVRARLPDLEADVLASRIPPALAAEALLRAFGVTPGSGMGG